MDKALFDEMAAVEDRHWWFRAREEITMALLEKHLAGIENPVIGDFGTGTGHMLAPLSRLGKVYGMESSPEALEYALSKGVAEVRRGSLPHEIPYGEGFFDAVLMQDVLEHVPEATAALASVRAAMKPGGVLLLTVPALQGLYCGRDRFHGHVLRYDLKTLGSQIVAGGLDLVFLSYYNFLLFLPAAATRLFSRYFRGNPECTDLSVLAAPANSFFRAIFASEKRWLSAGRTFPWGVSAVAVARRPVSGQTA